MADSYKTMKRAETHSADWGDDFSLPVYECEVCHGVTVEPDSDIEELTCSLCDENAPLMERYRMGWNTLEWFVMEYRGEDIPASEFSFDSINFWRINGFSTLVDVMFEYEQASIEFDLTGFSVSFDGKKEIREFNDGLDAGGDQFTPRILAQEVVNRVRHDLKLKYAKEA